MLPDQPDANSMTTIESLDDDGSIVNSQYATSNIFPTGITENRYKKSLL